MMGMLRGAALAAVLAYSGAVSARDPATWIGTWATSPAGFMTLDKVGAWILPPRILVKGTLRFRVRVAMGGQALRLRFSNEYGATPLRIEAASVGTAGQGLDALPGSLRRLTFGGQSAITIPVGAPVVTDPIDLPVRASSDLVVSVYVPDGMDARAANDPPAPSDPRSLTGPLAVEGADRTLVETLPGGRHVNVRPTVSAIHVLAHCRCTAAVTFGDSITDGAVDAAGERGWPGALARRLRASTVSVVNAGIGGNRLLETQSFFGRSALARLDQDVFSVPGLKYLVVLEGINDIGMSGPGGVFGDTPLVEPEQLVAAYRQIIERAHEVGIKVYGGTLLPFEGAFNYTAEKETVREAVNAQIRTSGMFDGVIDFDLAVRDPAQAHRMKAEYDSGDHLHPGAAGYRKMGDSVDLRLFD